MNWDQAETYALWFGGGVAVLEVALAAAMKADARDGKVDFPWFSKAAYWVHKGASYLLILPDLLMPFRIKPQIPILAAVKRYKELKDQIHVDDLPLAPWEERDPK